MVDAPQPSISPHFLEQYARMRCVLEIAWLHEPPRVNTLRGGHRANLHKSVAFSPRLKFLDAAGLLSKRRIAKRAFRFTLDSLLNLASALHESRNKGRKFFRNGRGFVFNRENKKKRGGTRLENRRDPLRVHYLSNRIGFSLHDTIKKKKENNSPLLLREKINKSCAVFSCGSFFQFGNLFDTFRP